MATLTDSQLLAAEVDQTFRQYVSMPNEHAYTVSTLWTLHTGLRGHGGRFLPYHTPRLYFGSKVAGCGKTLATEVTLTMCVNGEFVLEPTPPSMVSLINDDQATLGIDEIDLLLGRGKSKSATRAILNSGYKRGAAVTKRRQDEAVRENIHAPIVMNGKNANLFLNSEAFETLRSRSLSIILERKPLASEVVKYRPERHEPRLRTIGRRIERWGLSNAPTIVSIDIDHVMPPEIANRDEECWTVLFQLATFIGGEWPDRVNAAARAFVLNEWGDDDEPMVSPAEDLRACAHGVFDTGESFLPTNEILDRLTDAGGDHWWVTEWAGTSHKSKTMSFASTLRVFGIYSVRQTYEGVQEYGYRVADLVSGPSAPSGPADLPHGPAEDDWTFDDAEA